MENMCGLCPKKKKKLIRLKCGHSFCLVCYSNEIMKTQWFKDFPCDEPLFCPDCTSEVSRDNWETVINYLTGIKRLKGSLKFNIHGKYKIVYNLYTPDPVIDTSYRIQLNKINFYI
jgi:hypothetical protein